MSLMQYDVKCKSLFITKTKCNSLCKILSFHGHPVQLSCVRQQWRTQEFFSGGGSTISVEDRGQRGRGSGGGSPLVRSSGGSCNLLQEISFHIRVVKFS